MRAIEAEWGYLELRSDPEAEEFVTWRLVIASLLSRFGGVHGAAIPVDIVHSLGHGKVIVRCPGDSLSLVAAALTGVEDGRTINVLRTSSYLPILL